MPRTLCALFLSALVGSAAPPADAPAPDAAPDATPGAAAPEQPSVRNLGNGKFGIGLVTFDQKTREITFLAEVNMKDGPLEFALVHENGKIHESILITKARPFHINLALKLLRYQESKELEPILDEDYRPTGKFPVVPERIKNAARVEILLAWENEKGTPSKASLNDWVTYALTKEPLPALPWIYGGSYIHEQRFQAEAAGDIAALFFSNASLFNWPGKDHHLDDVWLPTTKRIPAVGTVVTVTVRPFTKAGAAAPDAESKPVPKKAPLLKDRGDLNPRSQPRRSAPDNNPKRAR